MYINTNGNFKEKCSYIDTKSKEKERRTRLFLHVTGLILHGYGVLRKSL